MAPLLTPIRQSSPLANRRSSKKSRAQYYTSPSSPISALRFIDQIDFYLWQASGNESTVLEKIPATLTNELQVSWYKKLLASVFPRPLTITDIRRALLRDFGVDTKTQRRLLSRYDGGDLAYLKGQSFKLVMHYMDEIEALKGEFGRVKDDKDEAAVKWKRLLVKAQVKHKQEMRTEKREVAALTEEVEDLRLAVKGLTSMLGGSEVRGGEALEKAFERYQQEMERSAERFRMVLVQAVTAELAGGQPYNDKKLPDSYRRPDTLTDVGEQHVHSNARPQGVSSLPTINEVASLRERLKQRKGIMSRGLQSKVYNIHLDTTDHTGNSARPLSID